MIIRHRRGTSLEWTVANPVLSSGELGYETDTGRHKIGNGSSPWTTLDSFIPSSEIAENIQEAINSAQFVGVDGTEILAEHINAINPHPAYDDGPSFLLIYQNAKV